MGSLYQRVQRVPARILVLVQYVTAHIFALAPSAYTSFSDHTRIVRRYQIYDNPVKNIYLAWSRPYFTQHCERTVCRTRRMRLQFVCP